ncbi:Protein IQ-DOMAIN 14 [Senna tora]|uniref:Protein IQ-DOMAIN 14 n=1 Tax=Senna tora TaxID=362788 RepID=A0A834TZA4_9FABA|nr:Protein IQ-DOMAIN 14 [Senna tora]
MGISQKWLKLVRRRCLGSSHKDIVIPRTSTSTSCSNQSEKAILRNETTTFEDLCLAVFSRKDVAAIKIQACFRGHLARRAYRALRSLVKLQALVRGVCVRRQSRIALHCMHALVRLQVRVRARQLLGSCHDS